MGTVASPVAVLPNVTAKSTSNNVAENVAVKPATGRQSGVTGGAGASNTAVSNSAKDATPAESDSEGFGDLLAKQLNQGAAAPQSTAISQLQATKELLLDDKSDATSDSSTQDTQALAAQLQADVAAQLLASNIVVPQPSQVAKPIALADDGVASQKVGEVVGQSRQVIAGTSSELADLKRHMPANEIASEKVDASKEDASRLVNQAPAEKKSQTVLSAVRDGAEKTQLAAARELDLAQHAATERKHPVSQVAANDAQPSSTSFSQMISSQQGQSASQSAVPSTSIQSPVGASAWGNELGSKVVWMVGQQHQGVEMHLNPPALGPLEVRVTMSDGQANLSFMTQHVPVREAIEGATARLREMLGDSGISMGSVSVNVGTFAQQDTSAQHENARSASAFHQFGNEADTFSGAPVVAVRSLYGNGMVDTFA